MVLIKFLENSRMTFLFTCKTTSLISNSCSCCQESINLLMRVPCLSIPGTQTLALAIVMRTDLEAIEHTDDSIIFTERTMENYLQAQNIILKQVQWSIIQTTELKLLHYQNRQLIVDTLITYDGKWLKKSSSKEWYFIDFLMHLVFRILLTRFYIFQFKRSFVWQLSFLENYLFAVMLYYDLRCILIMFYSVFDLCLHRWKIWVRRLSIITLKVVCSTSLAQTVPYRTSICPIYSDWYRSNSGLDTPWPGMQLRTSKTRKSAK